MELVIPVLNESHVLAGAIDRLVEFLRHGVSFPWYVLIIDNGSTDGTGAVGVRLSREYASVRYQWLEQRGRGRALRRAWTESNADFSVYMDVDLSTELEAIPRVVESLQNGAHVVTGSRLDRRSQVCRCLKREILSRGYNRLIRWLLRTRSFDDAQCGFKGVQLRTVRTLLPLVRNQTWFFDTELLVLAEYAGLRVESVPIRWIEDTDSRVNVVKTVIEDLRGLARLRRTARRLAGAWRSGQHVEQQVQEA